MRDDAPDQTGPAVRGYCVERLIGAGGAAAVYEARRLGPGGPGERVACKVMHAEQRTEPQHREQARLKAVIGLRVTAGHPNLVEILDFFDDAQARHCIVMELVGGASVADLRGPDSRLPFPVIRRVAVEVLEALAYLHGRGVLHRDLSPRNRRRARSGAAGRADRAGRGHARARAGIAMARLCG
jgi:serine/threonine protein kinase